MEFNFANNFSTHRKERFKTILLIKQPCKIIKKTFLVSLTSNKPHGGIFSKKTKQWHNSISIVRLCLLFVSIKYSVFLHSSLHSYNRQFPSWLVRLYDFYYVLVVKLRLGKLARSVNNPSQLVSKNRTHSPTMK